MRACASAAALRTTGTGADETTLAALQIALVGHSQQWPLRAEMLGLECNALRRRAALELANYRELPEEVSELSRLGLAPRASD